MPVCAGVHTNVFVFCVWVLGMQDGRRRQFKGINYSETLCPSLYDRHFDLLCLHIWTKDSQVQSATHLNLCNPPPIWAAEVDRDVSI